MKKKNTPTSFKKSLAPNKTTSRVLTARVPIKEIKELEKIYPTQSPSQIVLNLVHEKLARKHFEEWIESLKKVYRDEDFDSESS